MQTSKIFAITVLVLGASVAAFAKNDNNGSVLKQIRNDEAVRNGAMTPGHNRHDTDGDGSDDHMDGRNGNGYGHGGGRNGGGTGGHGGGGNDCPPVPEPASMATLGVGAGIMALKRRRAAKKNA